MQIDSLCVQDKCSILLHRVDNVILLDAILMVASNKVGLFNEIVACDGLFSKVKIRDHHSSALVGIIVEVRLDLVIKNENENILKTKEQSHVHHHAYIIFQVVSNDLDSALV